MNCDTCGVVVLDDNIFGAECYHCTFNRLRGAQAEPNLDCWHDWKDYIGITHVYRYCSKCDKKAPKVD